jgi:hypothetical protein
LIYTEEQREQAQRSSSNPLSGEKVLKPAPKGIINSKPVIMKKSRFNFKIHFTLQPTAALPAHIFVGSFPLLIPTHMLMRGMRSMH